MENCRKLPFNYQIRPYLFRCICCPHINPLFLAYCGMCRPQCHLRWIRVCFSFLDESKLSSNYWDRYVYSEYLPGPYHCVLILHAYSIYNLPSMLIWWGGSLLYLQCILFCIQIEWLQCTWLLMRSLLLFPTTIWATSRENLSLEVWYKSDCSAKGPTCS